MFGLRWRVVSICLAVVALGGAVASLAQARPSARPGGPQVLLTLHHRPGLDAFVRSVSDPGSARYRDYLSVRRLATRYGARRGAVAQVRAWLRARGLAGEVGPTDTYVVTTGWTGAAARAFGISTKGASAAAGHGHAVAVPAGLRGVVSSAEALRSRPLPITTAADPTPTAPTPGSALDRYGLGSGAPRTGSPAGCTAGTNAGTSFAPPVSTQPVTLLGYTPNQYTTAYGLAALQAQGIRGQGSRVSLIEVDSFQAADVAAFASCFGLTVPKISTTVLTRQPPAPGVESTLDLEVLLAGAPGLSSVRAYDTTGEPAMLLKAIAASVSARTPPNVVSISLGICEPAWAGSIDDLRAINSVLEFAAGAGISVLAASGDDGSADCSASNPAAIPAVSAPGSLPYVTSVGGTNITLNSSNHLQRQVVWNDAPAQAAATGGGLSVLFNRPWYQRDIGSSDRDLDDVTRVVPDIAAFGDPFPGYAIYCTAPGAANKCVSSSLPSGGWIPVAGSSASTPLMAAAVALMDQQAHRQHQHPLGFINPLLYTLAGKPNHASVLRDVIYGSNDTGTALPAAAGGGKPLGAYSAGKGYDATTGWGSLKVPAFSKAASRAAARARTTK